MLYPKGVIKPLAELLQEQHLSIPTQDFFPNVLSYYSEHGQLMALPFNTSMPVMFYNMNALKKVGYDEKRLPQTWQQLEDLAKKLKNKGFKCAYTSAYPAWINIEAFAKLHHLQYKINDDNYFKAILYHLSRLRNWQKKHLFEYAGRVDEATALFTSERCAILSHSSGFYNSLKWISFPVSVSALPLDTTLTKEKGKTINGGGALWISQGQTPEIYYGIAQFILFLSQPKIQDHWHEKTGYLPLGIKGGYQLMNKKSDNPILGIAQTLWKDQKLEYQRNIPMAENQMRELMSVAFEIILSDIKPAKQALSETIKQINRINKRFVQNTGSNGNNSYIRN